MVNRSSNKTAVPEAKSAMDRFKFEVASELGVPLSDGYNGNLTSKQNGSVGGYMVKKMIEQQERQMSSGIPCHLSFSGFPSADTGEAVTDVSKTIKLFLNPEQEIPPGCRI